MYSGAWHIDWNIGPAAAAARPRSSRLLVEKHPIPFADEPAPMDADDARVAAQKSLEFFWAIAPIAVKYAGRGWTRRAILQDELLSAASVRLWRLAHGLPLRSQDEYDQNRRMDPTLERASPQLAPHIDGREVLRAIRARCELVEGLHPTLARLGAIAPDGMVAQVAELALIAEAEVARGGSRPDEGSRR